MDNTQILVDKSLTLSKWKNVFYEFSLKPISSRSIKSIVKEIDRLILLLDSNFMDEFKKEDLRIIKESYAFKILCEETKIIDKNQNTRIIKKYTVSVRELMFLSQEEMINYLNGMLLKIKYELFDISSDDVEEDDIENFDDDNLFDME